MKAKQKASKASADRVVKDIRRASRKQYGAEEKMLIVRTACAVMTEQQSCGAARV